MICRICGTSRQKLFVCKMCESVRHGMSWDELKQYASLVTNYQDSEKRPQLIDGCEQTQQMSRIYSRRAAMVSRDKKKRGCSGDVVSAPDLAEWLQKNPCYYCGKCSTGIDRLDQLDCYPTTLGPGQRAACSTCNVMRKNIKASIFIKHLSKIAQFSTQNINT